MASTSPESSAPTSSRRGDRPRDRRKAGGRAQHKRLAKDEGRQEGQQEFLLRQLAWRFGELPETITERVNQATSEELEHWGKRILGAASLDDIFASP